MTVEVSPDEFPDEIRLWWDVSTRLTECADVVEALVPVERAFTFLGDATALQYEGVRTHAWVLLVQGAHAARDIAESLRQTHVTYLTTDESAKARLDGMGNGS
ncbi:hypothetical protein Bcav_1641 [Beutenbergia cavernae DSM 12333]|uniref:Uncharacterized protein n=1 Tax=Beutenbergia cavernae (strain ATCC BAA-8 / DSM 12333 / CCUG 43141 / JCM 11478 / NBRC 16432 / NCIMB 13614 / HKI 0122) TaxID=471853 RepID=C5C3Y4_BEUC1|nr:hypothetical protein [Beutenbergia cavernae]ACQ79897.1 hypothetical protein Bcav_1641 [Beutenbergia cavernae DSM 12333]